MMLLGTYLAGTLALLAGLGVDYSAASPDDDWHDFDLDYECTNPEVCQNGGTCLFQVFNLVFCSCPVTYDDGLHCEYYNHCHSSPCQNGGICDNDYWGDEYYCVCREGWTGQNCQTVAGPTATGCLDIDCEHGGTCYHYADASFCLCQTQYYGYFCEIIDDFTCNAQTAPCANGGTCVSDTDGEFACQCTADWAGRNCTEPSQVVMLCDHFCENAGSCYITEEREPACHCAPGWTGERCSQTIPPVRGPVISTTTTRAFTVCDARPAPCGDNGRCVPRAYGGHSCQCDKGWSGNDCRDRSGNYEDNQTQPGSFPVGGIVGSSVGSLVLIFVIFGACFILNISRSGKLRRSRPPRAPPAPTAGPSIIYDPRVHDDFDGSVHGLVKPGTEDVYGSDRYQPSRIPRRYTPTPGRDRHARPSNVVRNPGAGAYDYAYAPGPSSAVAAPPHPPRAPAPMPMPMPGLQLGHEYAYAMSNAAYEPSPIGRAAVVGPPPAYSRAPSRAPSHAPSHAPSRAPSKARSEHTYQSISEYAHPPSRPQSEAGPAPSVKSAASHYSSKK